MSNEASLLPPLTMIHERLTRNQRERHRLRTLLRLAIEVDNERRETIDACSSSDAARPEVKA
jgi:hypothetical protein